MKTLANAARGILLVGILAGANIARAQNHAPTNIGLTGERSVPEYSPPGTFVGDFFTIDPDAGNTFTYTFGAPYFNSEGCFKIVGAQLQVDQIANSGDGQPVSVISTDQGGLFFSKNFTITISGVNDPPTDIGISPDNVPENSESGTLVGFLRTESLDPADHHTYVFVAPNSSAGGRFTLDEDGTVRVGGLPLNFEAQATHTISARSTDLGGLFVEKNVDIHITNVNESPTNIALSGSRTVVEGAVNGANIGTLSTIDPDQSETFTYSFNAPDGSAGGRFQIAGAQLQVGNGQLIDYETRTSHPARIRSTDHGGLSTDKVFTITVQNVENEAPTNIALSGARTVNENAPNGTLVGNLTTIHPGGGGTFTYAFIAPESNAGGRFKIVGAQLQVANGALIDYETKTSHAVRIRSTNQGGLTTDKAFTITVVNVPE